MAPAAPAPQVRVGFVPPFDALTAPLAARRAMVESMAAHDIDHIGLVDHVSFRGGQGYDGLVHAGSVLSLDDRLPAYLGLYLLPLRHPLLVARQLATIAEIAPGRLTFAVGVGGDDRAEVANCGIDPRTRGARMDECLVVLQSLLSGGPVTFEGEHLSLREAVVRPAPDPPIPIVVGGRSDHAHRRVARFGDGWLGLWTSAGRYGTIVESIAGDAEALGRPDVAWQHALTVWVGLGRSATAGRDHLAPAMADTYQQPFTRFERWSPCGPPDQIASYLWPYVEAGCSTFNLMPRAGSLGEVVEGVAEIRRLLLAS